MRAIEGLQLRPARVPDAPAVASCVCEAHVQYIERVGRQPQPMLEDYAAVIAASQVGVALHDDRLVGVIVMAITGDGFYVDNVAVRPAVKGRGVGRCLLEVAEAEARRLGHASNCLATHELMHENRALYARCGFVEVARRVVNGFPRVFFRKSLA